MDAFLQTAGEIATFVLEHLWIWNMLFAVIIVFFERRDPKSVWAWLMLLFFIPVVGFLFYLFLGQNLHKQKLFRIKEVEDHLSEAIRQQEYQLKTREFDEEDTEIGGYTDLIMYNLETAGSVVSGDNDIDIFTDGNEKFGYWRDTHLRIRGTGVLGLQLRFILDWNYAARENLLRNQMLFENNESGVRDNCELQIISSGPDHQVELIRDNYLRLINKAQKSIYIQTPYFIPDESIFNALKIAVRSGIEVNIMIPCKPDHPFVYWATYSYMGELVMAGAGCYIYNNGFLHSKGMIVDCKAFCYGTANMDIRSFALNFEVNAVVYNHEKAYEMEKIFREDLKYCTRITRDKYASRKLSLRLKEQVCRLLSPLL